MFSNTMPFEIRPDCIKLNYFRNHHVGVYLIHAVIASVLANYGFVSVVIVSDNLAALFNGAVVGQSVKINTKNNLASIYYYQFLVIKMDSIGTAGLAGNYIAVGLFVPGSV